MDAKLKELQEQKNAKAAVIKELAGRQENWTAEDRTAWDVVNKEYDDIAAALTARDAELKNSAAVQARLKAIEDEQRAVSGDRAIGFDGDRRRELDPERIARDRKEVQGIALQAWMRAGRGMELTQEHRTACKAIGINPGSSEIDLGAAFRYSGPAWCSQSRQVQREFRVGLDVATSGAGVETIPEGFMAELERRRLEFAHVRQVCRVIFTASGNPLPWPKVDDTSNSGVKLDEATTFGTSVDPTFSAVTFNAYKYSSKPVFISQELLEDSAFNLSSEIASMLGERLGRIEGSAMTTGDGSGDPNGIVTAAGTGVTSAAATAFTADEIITLVHSLDPAYRTGSSVGFMFHDTALLYMRKFKDANGQYLWAPGMTANEPDRLFGFPYTINQAMEPLVSNVPVTAKKHVLFGDFSKYVIRDVSQMRFYRLDERYRDTDQTAFIAFKRLDGDTIRAEALKVLLQA
jgi:HK97 family phage major capsid protein